MNAATLISRVVLSPALNLSSRAAVNRPQQHSGQSGRDGAAAAADAGI